MSSGRPNGYPVQANTHTPLISGPGLLDATSQYPSHGSYHDTPVSTHHYASGHSLALPRLPQHASSQPQRFEASAQWNTPQMLQAVDPIQPYVSDGTHSYRRYQPYSHGEGNVVPFRAREKFGGAFLAYA